MGGRRVLRLNGADLCLQEFGESGDPAILLIAGAASSMDWWDTALCERLAAGGRRVVRYDLRDTGQSATYPPGEPDYTIDDLVLDVAALVEALHLVPVHLAGISMGGGLAQQLAIRSPELLASLTLFSTSPGEGPDLPGMSPGLSFPASPDWGSEESVAQNFVDVERALSGSIPVDEARIRAIAHETIGRSASLASAENHYAVLGGPGGEPRERLAEITAPTLVIHGTEDPLLPIVHGEAIAREIPGARLLRIEGMGHQNPPPPTWDQIVPAVLEHTA